MYLNSTIKQDKWQGFASSKYDREKKRAAQSRGGKAPVPKGFAKLSPEKLREVARKGGLA